MVGDKMSDCKFGELYSDYVQGSPFEHLYNPHADYNPVICCHKDAPYMIFMGVKDNFQCKKAKAAGQCPIDKKVKK